MNLISRYRRAGLLPALLLAAVAPLAPGAIASAAAPQVKTPKALPEGVTPFEVAAISPTSWYGRFGFTNCAWIDMGDGVLLVDTGGTPADTANLKKQIQETAKKPVRWIVMTHLHGDSNDGLKQFLAPDVTIFVNMRAAASVAAALAPRDKDAKAKPPTVIGVSDRLLLAEGGRRIEIGALSPAHTEYDLYAYFFDTAAAYVGDLVSPGRCPMLSDPGCDPKGWLTALDRIDALHPALIIGTRGDSSRFVVDELTNAREYLKRVMDLLVLFKSKSFAEARVAGELSVRKLGDYCPSQLDTTNVVALYRRLNPDGTFMPPAASKKPLEPGTKPIEKK